MFSTGHAFSRKVFFQSLLAFVLAVPGYAFSDLPDLIQRIKPAIVAVGSYDRTRSPAFNMRGTGFAVGDGTLVATNSHVLPELLDGTTNETLVIRLPAAPGEVQQRFARIVLNDKARDLALLRVEGAALPALPLRTQGMLREGQAVAFIGFPIGGVLGLSPVTHRGIISAVTPIALPGGNAQQLNEKVVRRLRSGSFDVYQLDGTAYPGNSGGPLFDMDTGEVVGVIDMVFVKATKESTLSQPSGISFAVPVQYLEELLKNVR